MLVSRPTPALLTAVVGLCVCNRRVVFSRETRAQVKDRLFLGEIDELNVCERLVLVEAKSRIRTRSNSSNSRQRA